MELAREMIGFREYVCGSGRLGGTSSKIPAGTAVDRCGPVVGDAGGSPMRLISAGEHYVWVVDADVAGDWDGVRRFVREIPSKR